MLVTIRNATSFRAIQLLAIFSHEQYRQREPLVAVIRDAADDRQFRWLLANSRARHSARQGGTQARPAVADHRLWPHSQPDGAHRASPAVVSTELLVPVESGAQRASLSHTQHITKAHQKLIYLYVGRLYVASEIYHVCEMCTSNLLSPKSRSALYVFIVAPQQFSALATLSLWI